MLHHNVSALRVVMQSDMMLHERVFGMIKDQLHDADHETASVCAPAEVYMLSVPNCAQQ